MVTIRVAVTTTFGVMTKVIVNDRVSRFFCLWRWNIQPVEHLVHGLDCVPTQDNHPCIR